MDHDGTGTTTVTVSSTVTGGADSSDAAIITNVSSAASVVLNSGAAVGTGTSNAIVGGAGDTSVTVNSGATVTGKISLGSGTDTLTFAGGTFSNVTEMQGGAGDDTLRFSGGSGSLHATVQSQGLKGWESIVVESGATLSGNIRLADSSDNLTFNGATIDSSASLFGGAGSSNTLTFNGVSETLSGANLTGWENVVIARGSRIKFGTGGHALTAGTLSVIAGGTVDIGQDGDTDDVLTLTGNFAGGGMIALDANFSPSGAASDKIVITGTLSGTTTVSVSGIGTEQVSGASRPERIEGVITVQGGAAVSANAFAIGAGSTVSFGSVAYRLVNDRDSKVFDLKRFFTNKCNETEAGSGIFTCSGTDQIGASQTLSASGNKALMVTLNSETPVGTEGTAFVLTQTGGTNGITLTQSATGESVVGAAGGIAASNAGGGAVSINVNATVTGRGGDGISANDGESGSGISITAASVSGANSGIEAIGSGTGAVSVSATGTVTGAADDGIYARTGASGGALAITAAAVAGGTAGIRAVSSGTSAVSVNATGAVTATGTGGIGINASASGGNVTISAAAVTGTMTGIKIAATGTGTVSISATGAVMGTGGDGIFVDHDGSGAATITVTAAVTGGTGNGVAAIRTDVSTGGATILLNNGASVGAGTNNAIVGSGGNTVVTVNTGAAISGKVSLGGGTDTLTFAGGTFTSVSEMDGGAGNDTLRFSGGSGSLHATVQSDGLKGWESVIVESGATISGAIKLAASSDNLTLDQTNISSIGTLTGGNGTGDTLALNNLSGSLNGSNVTGWDTVRIGARSTVSFGDSTHGVTAGTLSVEAGGKLVVGDDQDTSDALTVTGDFSGGGAVVLDVNFAPNAGASDMLTITGDVSGTTTIDISKIDETGNIVDTSRPDLITGVVRVTGAVTAGAFTASGDISFGAIAYRLEFNATAKRFDLKRYFTNRCYPVPNSPGAFTCSGANQIGASQSLSGGTNPLLVTLYSETPVGTDLSAFVLTQSAGSGGITFVQSANGQSVTGANSGIVARNTEGGAVSINVNGQVTGRGGDGISASDGAGGGGVTITAASVSGSDSGIEALGSGTGAVTVRATGTVTGASEEGIYAKAGTSGSTVTVTAAAVTGGKFGIKAVGGNARNVLINASGAVSATAGTGIDGLVSANGNLMITAAAVTGSAIGIKAVSSGTGNISVKASGEVIGTGTAGVQATGGTATGALTINAATVTGKTGIEAKQGSANALNIAATGTVTGTGAGGVGIDALASSAGLLTITAAAVTGSAVGIRAVSSGAAAVTVNAGTVMATGAGGTGIDASASGGNVTISAAAVTGTVTGIKIAASGAGSVSIAASGAVTGSGGDGIFVDHDGAGATTITVTTAVTGGAGNNSAAIRTDVSTGGATILLGSGASVGAGTNNAIMGGAGNSAVTVNTGASIAGKVSLGAGSDTLTFAGGTFSNATGLDGGEGNDTLTFSSGAGTLHNTVRSEGLKGWESIVVESGATIRGNIKLAVDSGNLTFNSTTLDSSAALDGGMGASNALTINRITAALSGSSLTNWENVVIGAGSSITLGTGAVTLSAQTLTVSAGGTLDARGADNNTDDHLTVSGSFAGGGTLIINANFTIGDVGSDKLTITGNLSGVTSVNIVSLGNPPSTVTDITRLETILGVITVQGDVAAGATFRGSAAFGALGYQLVSRANGKIFDLEAVLHQPVRGDLRRQRRVHLQRRESDRLRAGSRRHRLHGAARHAQFRNPRGRRRERVCPHPERRARLVSPSRSPRTERRSRLRATPSRPATSAAAPSRSA